MHYARIVSTAILSCSAAAGLAAQQTGPDADPEAPPAAGVQEQERPGLLGVQLVGGLTAYTNAPHATVGGLLHVHVGDWSLLSLGMMGWGGDYDSLLYGGALGRHLTHAGPVALSVFGGFAYYHEVGWSGVERSATGPLFGGIATLDLHPLKLSVIFSDLLGRYEGSDVVAPFRFQVPRLLVGIGF